MEKLTGKYETVFIVSPDLSEEDTTALIEKFKKLISDNGTIDSVEDWGKRKLAYPINDFADGYYTLVKFTANRDFPAELERIFNITDGILRSIVVREEA